jgi:hypothetical protein
MPRASEQEEIVDPSPSRTAICPVVNIEVNTVFVARAIKKSSTDNRRAICKLYMAYRELPGEEFIGTGWLIADDLIATAGHCLYDHQNSGGFLKYIKVYFGYAGPESVRDDSTVYRYGVLGSCPSEFLKAESDTHDVGFVSIYIFFLRNSTLDMLIDVCRSD